MNTKQLGLGNKITLIAWTLLGILAVYSGVQANYIDSLNQSIEQQKQLISSLNSKHKAQHCLAANQESSLIHGAEAARANLKPAKRTEITHSDGENAGLPLNADSKHSETSKDIATSDNEFDQPEEIDPQNVREFFNELFDEATIYSYSDTALLEEGSALLREHIASEESDFESSLTAAYALGELTNQPISEHLSLALLQKASLSNDKSDLEDALALITEQDYSKSSLLAADLMANTNPDARMVGIYLMATSQDNTESGSALANQLYTYPEETIELLGHLIGE